MDGQDLRMDGSGERNVRKLLERSRWLVAVMAASVAVVLIILVVFWRRIDAIDVKGKHRVDMIDLRIDGLMRRLDAARATPALVAEPNLPVASNAGRGRHRDVSGYLDALTPVDLAKGTAILLTPGPLNRQAVFRK